MKFIPIIAGALLGLMFIAFSLLFLLDKVPPQDPPKEQAAVNLMMAFATTGYLKVIKVLELLGGILVAIPRTRNLGLLILGPIIINILMVHGLVMKEGLVNPVITVICLLSVYLLWVERKAWKGLVTR